MKIGENKLKVAVLMGGIGEERDISIQSGRCVSQALKEADLNVISADIQLENMDILDDDSIDVFFIALHGRFGEDGRLQQILEDKGRAYTGSGPAASRLAFDKMASKKIFAKAGVATPAAFKFNFNSATEHLGEKLWQIAEKYVTKPIRQGSTIGVAIADDQNSAIMQAQKCLTKFGDCMVEEYIPGREITVGILENQTLPIIEIRSKTGFYDYHAKYLDEQTEYLFDTINDSAMIEKINQAAMTCFNALGCRHFGRVDFILGNDAKPYVLELNTIPGFTAHSLLPKAAEKTKLSMSDLCIKIINTALFSPQACPTKQ